MNKRFDIGIPHGTLLAIFAAVLTFSLPAWLTALLVLWVFLSLIALLMMAETDRRDFIAGTLRHSNYTQIYKYFTGGTISYFWRKFCDDTYSGKNPLRILRNALTWKLYDRALLIAVVYPFFLLLVFWIVTGQDGQLGNVVIVPATDFWPQRAETLGAIVILILGVFGDKWAAASPNRVIRQASGWLTPLAGALAFAVAAALAFAVAVAVAGAFALAFAVAGAFAVAVAVALAVAVAVAVAGAFAGAGAVAVAGAFAGAVAVLILFEKGKQKTALVLLTFVIPLLWIIGLYFLPWVGISEQRRGLFLFLGVLPLINAIFDLVSYAVTLTLLRLGQKIGQPFILGLIDLAVAMILFLGLGAVLVAIITAMNTLSGTELFNLGAVFSGIKSAPFDYYWLYLMMFSTLLPTALHMGVAVLGLQALTPKPVRRAVAKLVDASPDKMFESVFAPLAVGAVWTLPFVTLGGGVYLAVTVFGDWPVFIDWLQSIGWWYFDRLQDLAQNLGNAV